MSRTLHSIRRYSSTVKRSSSSRATSTVLVGAFGATIAAYFLLPDASRSAPTSSKSPLSPSHFTPTTLVSTQSSGPDTKLLTVTIPPELIPPRETRSGVWSVFIKDDDIQVERPYTPLEGIDENGKMLFWIKRYPRGEVGRWLHSKLVGDTIELRGPLTSWHWKEDVWDHVVMVSGGTGITPFYQLFHNVIRHPNISPNTRFTLIHGSKSPVELPPPEILQPISAYAEVNSSRFKLVLHVDKKDVPSDLSLKEGLIDKSAIESALELDKPPTSWYARFFAGSTSTLPDPPPRTLVLVCGPDQMITAIAGPLGRNLSQGNVGGELAKMNFPSSQVWKLA